MARTTKPPLNSAAIIDVLAAKDFRVVYQPVVDLRAQKVFAYEALVRSKSPFFESPPALFEAAVEHSVTGELGRAIRQMSIDNCPETPLFLNIHPAELNEPWIVQADDPIFKHANDVYLEITESVPLSHFDLCQTILSEVRGRGVYLVVDDLGAGYSNLKYIADLQPRVVKLDRVLIAGLVRDSRLFKLVQALVVMCRELDAKVVAEGVETEAELDAVIASGARFAQGYLLARPAFPLPEITWPSAAVSRRKTSQGMRALPKPTRRR